MTAQDPQLTLPPWLRFQPSPDYIRTDASLTAISQTLVKFMQGKNVIQTKTVLQEHLLPLLAHLMQLHAQGNADVVRFVQGAVSETMRVAQEVNTEVLVGIPEEQGEDMIAALEEVIEFLKGRDDPDDTFAPHIAALDDVAGTIADLTIEEDEDEDEEEPDVEEPEPDDTPLVRDDPPLVATR